MSKSWVFEEIVEEKGNVEHLIAYALYKSAKYELACNKRSEGAGQDEIAVVLQTFHDNLLSTPGEQEQYRNRARVALSGFTAELEKRIKADYTKQFEKLQVELEGKIEKLERSKGKEIAKAKRDERTAFVKKVHQEQLDRRSQVPSATLPKARP